MVMCYAMFGLVSVALVCAIGKNEVVVFEYTRHVSLRTCSAVCLDVSMCAHPCVCHCVPWRVGSGRVGSGRIMSCSVMQCRVMCLVVCVQTSTQMHANTIIAWKGNFLEMWLTVCLLNARRSA